MELTDGVITLRRWREDDLSQLVAVADDPEIARWTTLPSPCTEEDGRDWLSRAGETAFAIVAAGSGKLLGAVGVDPVEDGMGEVGYWVGAHARRQGTATRAVLLASRWALREGRFSRLSLLTESGNVASQRVAERAGFRREGELRSWREIKGERRDLVMYSLLPEDL
jgi:RimJ/RimL family protein N-acetyltransferase